MIESFDAEAFREQLQQNRRNRAEAYWSSRMHAGGETSRFATRLMKQIPPADLFNREFPRPIYASFSQVTSLSSELGLSLEDPDNVGNLLEQGFSDTRDMLLGNDIVTSDMSLETAVRAATLARTTRSIANIALYGQEGMRNRIRGGLHTAVDPQTGLTVLDEMIEPTGGSEIYNRGCPFASKEAVISNPRSHEATMVFVNFAKYAGEIVARTVVQLQQIKNSDISESTYDSRRK